MNPMDHLVTKLKSIKNYVSSWIKDKKTKYWEEYSLLEPHIKNLYQNNSDFSISGEYLVLTKEVG